jgi:5-(carboxyamino)imidazole ribonucleotide mutase
MDGYETVYEGLLGHKFNYRKQTEHNIHVMAGSISDKWHCNKIINEIEGNKKLNNCNWHVYYMSAHKNTTRVLNYLNSLKGRNILITVAGMSNALSGVTTCNCDFPVFACPPFKDKVDMMVNINSTLQMPSNTPVMTVLSVKNVVKCCERIICY